jgi:hypothetical protein
MMIGGKRCIFVTDTYHLVEEVPYLVGVLMGRDM